jgi:hypothetical protein
VENSPFLSDGTPNGSFPGNFGLAWYQSDIQANAAGNATVAIHTILLNQIFGFDAGAGLAPVNIFNVGFWFNDPADAADCGFTGTTPFNGEHAAGSDGDDQRGSRYHRTRPAMSGSEYRHDTSYL